MTQHALRTHRSSETEGPTATMRSYLAAIYDLAARNEPVIGARLATWMHVTPPTVTNIVQRMEEQGYIARDRRGAISLTVPGKALAVQVLTRHHLLECFLMAVMGMAWDEVHTEAQRLEPTLSPTLEERVRALAGQAATCPHGNPIPGRGAAYEGSIRLMQASSGQSIVLSRINEDAEDDQVLLRFLRDQGVLPGARFAVVSISASFGVVLQGQKHQITLTPPMAAQLWCRAG